ncbi:MAG: VCBS repeat-containing protein [Acidobacteriota bacterium]
MDHLVVVSAAVARTVFVRALKSLGRSGWAAAAVSLACLGVSSLGGGFGAPVHAVGPSDVGGGEDYGDWIERFDVLVTTREGLLRALGTASPGDVIYVDDEAVIDLTDRWDVTIPPGVTLASGRGRAGSLGGLLRTTTQEQRILLRVGGPNVRITGLRIQGPTTVIDGPDCGGTDAAGIGAVSDTLADWSLEVDNCELWAWPNAAISTSNIEGSHVHDNHIHHNRRRERTPGCRAYGLGYGVVTNLGDALIENNLFNHNRHDIASTGRPGSSYEARHNISVEGLIGHAFDMHGCPDRPTDAACVDQPLTAGTFIDIHHNRFLQSDHAGVVIRGIPEIGAWILNNEFRHGGASDSIVQRHGTGNLFTRFNDFDHDPFPAWFVSTRGSGYWTLRAFSNFDPTDLLLGDFDGDGSSDALRANGSTWFLSRAMRSAWEPWNTSGFQLPALHAGDFDGDGSSDIFRSSGTAWFLSWGGRGPWQQINTSSVPASSLRFGDFDGEGSTDVFWADGSTWRVSWAGQSSWQTINSSAITPDNLRFGDFDGDGSTDVFRANGSIWQVSWSGQSSWQPLNTSAIGVGSLAFCDFDGDGSTDVFRADGSTWHVSWSGQSSWQPLNVSSYPLSDLAFADVTGDGFCDILAQRHP